jgi:hypothetical protein
MRLVYYHEARVIPLTRRVALEPQQAVLAIRLRHPGQPPAAGPPDGLHRGDHHRRAHAGLALGPLQVHAQFRRDLADAGLRLGQELLAVRDHQRRAPVAPLVPALDQPGEHVRLARAGRQHEQRALDAPAIGGFDLLQRLLLIRPGLK